MTNDELKAAAEYLSSLPPREDLSFEALARKAKNIADAYLVRLAADEQQAREDAMFADDDWLCQHTRGMSCRLKWDCETREVLLGDTSLGIKRTRGQWRQLLEALKGGDT